MVEVCGEFGHVAQYRRKVIFSKELDLNSITTSASGTTSRWLCRFRSGLQATQLHYVMILGLDDNKTGTDPYVYWQLTEVGVGTTNSEELHYGYLVGHTASADDTTDEFYYGTIRQDISPDTEYTIVCAAVDYARPVACLVYEASLAEVDDALSGGVDSAAISTGAPIFDGQEADLVTEGHNLWKKNGRIDFAWSADSNAASVTINSATWTNAIDSGTGGPGAATAGANIENQYCARQQDSGVPVELSVYAVRTAGAGTCYVRVNDGTPHITTGAITSAGWYTVTGNLTAAALTKWDIEGQSDGSTTLAIWAVSLAEYEA